MIMRKFITYFFSITVMLIFLQHHLAASLSHDMQKIALFRFKQSLSITTTPTDCYFKSYDDDPYGTSPSHPKTMNWSMSSDHCTWEGVTCEHKTGDIIGLDLSCSQLEGAIHPNSTLFLLSHLRFLNLSHNDFSLSNQFPQEFGSFAKQLTHLNLSYTGLSGKVPSGISRLYKLVSLDLNENYGAKLEEGVFKSLLQNLTQLRVLNLQGVDISSVLPVNISTSLRVLNLEYTPGLQGVLPQEVFHLPNLEVLLLPSFLTFPPFHIPKVSHLPKVKWGSSASLQHLRLRGMNMGGGIPDSIGFLESLVSLELYDCFLFGPIPTSIGNLSQLANLGLSVNLLNGPIPAVLANLTNLRNVYLDGNYFTGPLPSFVSQLQYFDCGNNVLNGPIPQSFSRLGNLTHLDFSWNNFSGLIPQSFSRLVKLTHLDFSWNNFSGLIPQSFSQLLNLTYLDLSSNNFSGVLDLKMFSGLEYLDTLDLSDNNLSVRSASMTTLPPMLYHLGLSSCSMKEFPHFSRDPTFITSFSHLDLSNNQIEGEIPHLFGVMDWDEFESYLNLSYNRLTGGIEQLPWEYIKYLDLQSNMLNGSLPTLICSSSSLQILNLSHNKLTGKLPVCSENLTSLLVFDLRINNIRGNIPATISNFRSLETINLNGNKLQGRIPSSFAEFDHLKVLDLGSNHINDTFPQCLEGLPNLQVLVLRSNKFYGIINKSSKVEHPFPSLRIIDLSYNEFSGPLPAIYFKTSRL